MAPGDPGEVFSPLRNTRVPLLQRCGQDGSLRPFEVDNAIVICSYQFARAKAADVNAVRWDLVVIDEAHRLRNAYKPGNVIANTLKLALKDVPKLLLTATPLQNSLLELFGLVSFIDEHAFGDLKSFREQFAALNDAECFDVLKARLKPLCHRTLRRQVTAYVPFTRRHPMVQEFTPAENEDRLYDLVSEYLRRDNLHALPASQRSLMTLGAAEAAGLVDICYRGRLEHDARPIEGEDRQARAASRWKRNSIRTTNRSTKRPKSGKTTRRPWNRLQRRPRCHRAGDRRSGGVPLARRFDHAQRQRASVCRRARTGLCRGRPPGRRAKAIVFTESRRTQEYLQRVLADSPYSEGVVLFNGSNTDPLSRTIYAEWLERHAGTDRVTGSKSADMRSALVDYFREQGQIMIATEAGAEGINLQFCSLVVNYDLPWNPQRIEQRIGRCHRYGQKHDVVVVNFLNRNNEADQRVFRLLAEKFSLFEGVFGASDEVLGAIESGVDFEKRIAAIYQRCRTPEEIKASFDQLQLELGAQINEAMTRTRRQLLENFDAEVHEKLRISLDQSQGYLTRYERLLMQLTGYELGENAEILQRRRGISLEGEPLPGAGRNSPGALRASRGVPARRICTGWGTRWP